MSNDVIDHATTNSRFFASGAIVDISAYMDVMPSTGIVQMPFWNDNDTAAQVAHNGVNLTVEKLTQGQDKAPVLSRAKVLGSTDLAAALKGEDPVAAIEEILNRYWTREYDRIAAQNLVAQLSTVATGASMSANTVDISGLTGAAAVIDSSAMIDAGAPLGDADENLSLVVMHSDTRRKLEKLDLVEDVPDSEGKVIKQYRGKVVVTTDRFAPDTGVYSTFFLGRGAMGYSKGTPKVPVETLREPLLNGGEDALINRIIAAFHLRGVAFTGTPAGETATDTELQTATNWGRVWTAKNIFVTCLKHKNS
jgi:hypothetical protein